MGADELLVDACLSLFAIQAALGEQHLQGDFCAPPVLVEALFVPDFFHDMIAHAHIVVDNLFRQNLNDIAVDLGAGHRRPVRSNSSKGAFLITSSLDGCTALTVAARTCFVMIPISPTVVMGSRVATCTPSSENTPSMPEMRTNISSLMDSLAQTTS